MGGRKRIAGALSVLVLAGLIVLPIAVGQAQARFPKAPMIRITPYQVTLSDSTKVDAELGQVKVRERRANALSDSIEVAFIRLRSTSSRPGNPIIFLPGSPGGLSGTQTMRVASLFPFFTKLREHGDVIVLDYRGSGLSTPLLSCPAVAFPADVFATIENARSFFVGQARDCAAALKSSGRDIGGYSWTEIATDVDDVRRALGVKRVNIVGFSSGTHAALTTLRRYADGIDRIVFLGTEGPDDTRKLPTAADRQIAGIAALAAADTLASAAFPNFRGTVERVLNRLDQAPVTVEIPKPGSAPVRGVVGRFALEFITAKSISGPDEFATLPALYAQLDRGDLSGLTRIMRGFARRSPPSPLAYVLDAGSGASPARAARIVAETPRSLLGRGLNFPHPEIREAWGVVDAGEAFRRPVESRLPALFITGAADGNTPPEQAEAVRKGFPNSSHITIQVGGHSSTMTVPEVSNIIVRFLGGERITERRIAAPAIRFLVPPSR